MIALLKGVVDEVESDSIYLDVNGIVFEIYLSSFDLEKINIGNSYKIYIDEIIKEDNWTLFGFLDRNNRDIFRELIKINGVGPKVAIAILSTLTVDELLNVIVSNNPQPLTKVPKVGQKTAKKILSELTEIEEQLRQFATLPNRQAGEKAIAIEALEKLGFHRNTILPIIQEINHTSHQEIIKETLKLLAK